jgi:hypothetical protein
VYQAFLKKRRSIIQSLSYHIFILSLDFENQITTKSQVLLFPFIRKQKMLRLVQTLLNAAQLEFKYKKVVKIVQDNKSVFQSIWLASKTQSKSIKVSSKLLEN